MIMPEVRTTMEPWRPLVVDERTAYDLRQQGLLVEDDVNKAPEQDPSADTQVDAAEHEKETQDRRREELGESKSPAKTSSKAKD